MHARSRTTLLPALPAVPPVTLCFSLHFSLKLAHSLIFLFLVCLSSPSLCESRSSDDLGTSSPRAAPGPEKLLGDAQEAEVGAGWGWSSLALKGPPGEEVGQVSVAK